MWMKHELAAEANYYLFLVTPHKRSGVIRVRRLEVCEPPISLEAITVSREKPLQLLWFSRIKGSQRATTKDKELVV
jgi:hypothetical protein